MKKVIVVILVAAAFLAGCESKTIRQHRKLYMEYFKEILNDPNSLIVYEEKVLETGSVKTVFEVDYGAKNRMGGMVRGKHVFEVMNGEIYKIDGEFYSIHMLNLIIKD